MSNLAMRRDDDRLVCSAPAAVGFHGGLGAGTWPEPPSRSSAPPSFVATPVPAACPRETRAPFAFAPVLFASIVTAIACAAGAPVVAATACLLLAFVVGLAIGSASSHGCRHDTKLEREATMLVLKMRERQYPPN